MENMISSLIRVRVPRGKKEDMYDKPPCKHAKDRLLG